MTDIFTLQALRRSSKTAHMHIEPACVIALDGIELERVLTLLAGREATAQEVALAKAGGTYFDGAELAGAASATVTDTVATDNSAPAPTSKPFDKMTKAELDKALQESGFTPPDNWSSLRNFDRATFLQSETEKAGNAGVPPNAGASENDDLTI